MKKLVTLLVSVCALIPVAVSAQVLTNTTNIATGISRIVNILIPIAFTLALLYFFYGVAKYIKSEGSGKEEGRQIMIWGVVALFVMSSVWGLVFFLRGELGITDDSVIPIPTIQNGGGGMNLNV
jgi:NADH:ubiquinone oxidoreductase subunit 2 (subunit N)